MALCTLATLTWEHIEAEDRARTEQDVGVGGTTPMKAHFHRCPDDSILQAVPLLSTAFGHS